MSSAKLFFAMLLGVALVTAGCQPKTSRADRNRIGRTARGPVGTGANGQPTALQPSSGATQWGEILGQNDQTFQNELYYFTAPMLANAGVEEQLGYVAAQRGQQTGVVFWGEAAMLGTTQSAYAGSMSYGQLDGRSARIHIEIYDDRAGQTRADGTVRPQTIVHIGPDQDGFVSANGQVNGQQVQLTFTDQTGSVVMQGQITGQYFSGTIGYSNSYTGGQTRQLGQFNVPACGFFKCN